jgi:hypothetical protein
MNNTVIQSVQLQTSAVQKFHIKMGRHNNLLPNNILECYHVQQSQLKQVRSK